MARRAIFPSLFSFIYLFSFFPIGRFVTRKDTSYYFQIDISLNVRINKKKKIFETSTIPSDSINFQKLKNPNRLNEPPLARKGKEGRNF